MNNKKRKDLSAAVDLIKQALIQIEEIQIEEQDGFDNLPEGLQESEKGEQMERHAETIQDVFDEIEQQIDILESEVIEL